MQRFLLLFFLSLGFVCSLLPGCSPSSPSTPPPNNGVNDVRKACDVRNTWTNRGVMRCTDCLFAATQVSCNCEQFKDFAALCLDQATARKADPGCTVDVDNCVNLCDKTNCDCIEGCYASSASCKQLSAARDGCVANVCSQYCN